MIRNKVDGNQTKKGEKEYTWQLGYFYKMTETLLGKILLIGTKTYLKMLILHRDWSLGNCWQTLHQILSGKFLLTQGLKTLCVYLRQL